MTKPSETEKDQESLKHENQHLLDELETIYSQFLFLKDETDTSYGQLRERNLALEKKVRELEQTNAELEAAENQLIHSERLAAMGQLAASIVHELNNPLTVVTGYIDLLLKKSDSASNESRMLGIIKQHTEKMANLVRDILSFSRKQASPFGTVDINETVTHMVTFLDVLMKHRIVEINTSFGQNIPLILGNSQQLQQVFINLATNAGDAISGEGDLTITTECIDGRTVLEMSSEDRTASARPDSDIKAMCEQYERFVATRFIDDGPGIPADTIKVIFNPFFTTKPTGKGTGLGLSISRTIIERHNGNILVYSKPGEGTTFTVFLPVRSTRPNGSANVKHESE